MSIMCKLDRTALIYHPLCSLLAEGGLVMGTDSNQWENRVMSYISRGVQLPTELPLMCTLAPSTRNPCLWSCREAPALHGLKSRGETQDPRRLVDLTRTRQQR